jgi:tetratricopeptide (TPR) repeat protein
MVRKVPVAKGPLEFISSGTRTFGGGFPAVFFLAAAILTASPASKAESPASKNREGNRLFSEDKYAEAEKAYLDAQVKSPGKPEIIYNLGNSLIKQGKYPQGIQALQQSAGVGSRSIKADSLYNTGNALFSMGDYKGSAEAFIEALKLNPEDGDAKHNLELALQKLKQQEQEQTGESRDRRNPADKNERQPKENNAGRPESNEQDRERADARNEQGKQPKMEPETPVPREGSITREQAQHMLDAVRGQELEQQRKLMESRSRAKTNERDW